MNTIMLTVRIYNNLQFMKKYVSYFMLIAIVSVFVSCASSKSTTGENGAFPPTRNGCIHSLSMRERG